MFVVTLPVENFIDYFYFYDYTGDTITTYNGFIQPKEEFKEWFKFIKYFRSDHSDSLNFNEILSPKGNSYKPPATSTHLFGSYDVFDFEFPDEETALYFKLKFDKKAGLL